MPVAGAAELPGAAEGLAAASMYAMSLPALSLSNGLALSLPAVSSSNPTRGPKPLCREAAAQWLKQHLAGGPVVAGVSRGGPGTVRGAAQSAGLAWSTVQRAYQDLQVVGEWCPQTRKSTWRLPAAAPDAAPDAQQQQIIDSPPIKTT